MKSFFSEVGGGRSSRLSRILYIALHESEQVEVGAYLGLGNFLAMVFSNFVE